MHRQKSYVDDPSDWINVGEAKLKLARCYNNLPSLNLAQAVHFSACSYGGPIALAFASSTTSWYVTLRMSGGMVLKDKIEIADVHTLEWTRDQKLFVIDRRGSAKLFTSIGERVSENDLVFSNTIREVQDVCIFTTAHDSGVAVLDAQLRIFVVNSVSEPIVWSMHLPVAKPPTTWTCFQPSKELTRIVVVVGRDFYMGCQGEQLCLMDTTWAFSDGQYTRATPCAARRNLALYHSSGYVQVVDVSLSHEICRIEVSNRYKVLQLGWIGDECIFVQTSKTHLFIFNIKDPRASYDFNTDHANIGVEHDGIKLYHDSSMEFLGVVSKEEVDVLGVASSADGALLNEASRLLNEGKSHQSYEYASQVRDLPSAINSCTRVAAMAWRPEVQKSLLKSARYGLAFVNSFDTSEFVRVLRELRVLNDLRAERIGMPITYRQYINMGSQCVVNRLIDMACYGTAIQVCNWLEDMQDGVDRVLMEWVRRALKHASHESNKYEIDLKGLAEKISKKLSEYPHVSLADAAKKAIEFNLPKLARHLIEKETDDSKQVQVLLQLGDVQEALSRAAKAQRPQLMHQVVRHLMASQKRQDYELTIRKNQMAFCVYQDIVRQDSRGSGRQMLALLEQSSDFERQTLFHLDSAENELNDQERINALRRAKDTAQGIGDKNILELLNDLSSFAPSQVDRGEQNLTIRETVIKYAHDTNKVNSLKQQCKLSDKQVWLWTIEGLAEARRFEQLFEFAQKKSPVGYVPFIKACMKHNRHDEAKKYFAKVNGYSELINAHLAMGNYVNAAKMAYDRHDIDMLQLIYAKSHKNKEAYEKIGQLMRPLT